MPRDVLVDVKPVPASSYIYPNAALLWPFAVINALLRFQSIIGIIRICKRVADQLLRLASVMQPHIYERLTNDKSIRLLKLHSGDSNGPISCSLQVVHLNQLPAFSAISYTWGSDRLSHMVKCDGLELRTTASSHRVLHEICQSEHRGDLLWIDAICIDQSCPAERARQVALMRAIYSKSATTFVFLGEPSEPGHLALELGEKIIEMTRKFETRTQITEGNIEAFGLPSAESACWRALDDLFCQPWFGRVWVMQEYILSCEVLMVYGGVWKPSDFYVSVCSALAKPEHDGYGLTEILRKIREKSISQFWNPETFFLRSYLRLSELEVKRQYVKKGLSTLNPLFRQTGVKATDPRDYLYGVLGLLEESEANHPDLFPDYGLPVRETYIKAARYLLNKEGLVYLLRMVGFPQSISPLPSWVPDWSKSKQWSTLDLSQVNEDFSAGGNLAAVWRLSGNQTPDKLIIHGIIADTIDKIEKIFNYSTLPWSEGKARFIWGTAQMIKQSAAAAAGPSLAKTHIKTLTFGQSSSTLPSSEHDSASQVAEPFYHDDQWNMATAEEKNLIGGSVARVHVESAMLGFCLTRLGSVGRVPYNARIGDKICFFQGISKPFAIRSQEGRPNEYELVGDCYIHGKMCGEIFQGELPDVQEIVLV